MLGHQRNFPRQNVSEGGKLSEYILPFFAVSTFISVDSNINTDGCAFADADAHSAF
jgi:hypothetical protein